jgi:hypothetical protein
MPDWRAGATRRFQKYSRNQKTMKHEAKQAEERTGRIGSTAIVGKSFWLPEPAGLRHCPMTNYWSIRGT